MPYVLTANSAKPGSPTSWVKMDTESVMSGNSEYVSGGIIGNGGGGVERDRSRLNGHRTTPRPLPPLKGKQTDIFRALINQQSHYRWDMLKNYNG